MKVESCRDQNWLLSDEAFSIYSSCMYKPTYEKYISQMEHFVSDPAIKIFTCEEQGSKMAILVLDQSSSGAEIVGIAVTEENRRQGIGKSMISCVMDQECLVRIEAQTDDDSVGFYRKCGFSARKENIQYPDGLAVRYYCSLNR